MLTFLFTDIADSSQLWQSFPQGMSRALATHDDIMKRIIPAHGGQIVKSTGDGIHAAFHRVSDAARAAVDLQQALVAHTWGETGPLRVRMGVHTGEAEARDGDYFGTAVNKAARVMSLAAGGQVLLSDVSSALLRESPEAQMEGRLLGHYRLKGLAGRTGIYQLMHPFLPADFPAIPGGESVPNNLPAEMTRFVGREVEKKQVVNYLLDTEEDADRRRLVTLVGPGGTGKTRLSIRVARDLREAFSDGVWLVELAPLADPAMIPQAILAALSIQESPETPAVQLITTYMKEKQALLIFDNCEHLVERSAELVGELLQAAPLVQVLASSREALGVYGEVILRVPSLPVPDDAESDWALIRESDAVQLFISRAESANAQRWLTAEHGPAIAQICRRLDGIPLAIEMAAARLRIFSPAQILERLDDRFRLLTGGSRTVLPRQQTLQALIDWSYGMLSPEEQGLMQDLSVFMDGWTIEMAEEICRDWDVYTLLPQLVDKSLVQAEPQDDGMRYSYLETIRQYARDRLLESGRSAEMRERHLDFFIDFANTDTVLNAQGIWNWGKRIVPNLENCRRALTWAFELDPLKALEMAGRLSMYWTSAAVVEGAGWLNRAIDQVERAIESGKLSADDRRVQAAQAEAYLALVGLLFPMGHNEQAFEAGKKCVALYEGLEKNFRLVPAYGFMGLAGVSIGKEEEAVAALDKGLQLAKESGSRYFEAMLLNMKGLEKIYLTQDIPAAVQYMEQAIALEPTVGTQSVSGNFALIKIQIFLKNWERARELVDLAIENLPKLTYIDTRRQLYMYTSERGHIERLSGNLDAALNIYARMILLYRDLSMEPAVANMLECFAMIALQRGQLERSAQLFGAAEALREQIKANMTAYERFEYQAALSALRKFMDDEALEQSWLAGRNMPLERAIELARAYSEMVQA